MADRCARARPGASDRRRRDSVISVESEVVPCMRSGRADGVRDAELARRRDRLQRDPFFAPQKVAFRYRLEGHGTEWQAAGLRRRPAA
jgi:hypothetical protein